nr:hypothetical protein [Tanacetum cinerariifolium]
MSKVLQERGFGSLPSSTKTNLRDQSNQFQPLLERIRIRYAISGYPNTPYPLDRTVNYYTSQDKRRFFFQVVWNIITVKKKRGTMEQNLQKLMELHISKTSYPKRRKTQGVSLYLALLIIFSLTMPLLTYDPTPFLSTACAKIDVYKRKITLRVGEEKIIFKSVIHASSLVKRVYMLSLRERIELDLEARLMRETLVINRSLGHFLEDYIELNDLNEPIELRRNQGNNLIPTIEEGEVIKEFRTRDEDLDTGIDDYPSYCDNDKKIHINCAHNLKFSCMIGFEFTHVNFFPLLYVNVMSKKFHNSIMKDNMVYKGNSVVGALTKVPIFVGTFSVITDFAVLENMDAYRDEGIGDVIFGKPFLREVGIKAKRFDGMITIYNGNDEVTYQMVRSNQGLKTKLMRNATKSHHY